MPMFRYSSLLWFSIVPASAMFIISACTTHTNGMAKADSNWPVETRRLKSAGAAYAGPQYTIGIAQFDNKAPAKVSGAGAGAAAATILRSQFETAGLKAIVLNENAPKEAETFKALQRSGIANIGKNDAGSIFDAPDYLLSGAVTAYSEAEEVVDGILFRKKSTVARVTVDYMLADIATGKALVAESVTGEYRKTNTSASGPGAKSFFDPNLRDGALHDALAKSGVSVIRKLGSMPFQGKLLAVDGPSLVLKAGLRSQLKVGTQLAVYRVSEALTDPDNGRVLAYRESRIGVIQIGNHQDINNSAAAVVSGSGFRAGDVVKLIP